MAEKYAFKSTCSVHGKPCMVKTGVSEGPNKGKTYLICSNTSSPCDHKVFLDVKPVTCTKHDQMVGLACPANKDGEKRMYMRCNEGKKLGKWCFHVKVRGSSSSVHEDSGHKVVTQPKTYSSAGLRAFKDLNSITPKPDLKQQAVKTLNSDSTLGLSKSEDVKPKVTTQNHTQDPDMISLLSSPSNPSAAKAYLEQEIEKKKILLRMAERLPDKGARIKEQLRGLEEALKNCRVSSADIRKTETSSHPDSRYLQGKAPESSGRQMKLTIQKDGQVIVTQAETLPPHVIREMYASSAQQQRLYGGRMTEKRLEVVTTITTEAIESLHKQLESCPPSSTETEDPKHLTVKLMTHQRQALTWLLWREQQKPSGGILADDMGLGKTLTMISLVMKDKQSRKPDSSLDLSRPQWLNKSESVLLSEGTLIVCPASLIHQWAKEIEARCKPGSLSTVIYHGSNREQSIVNLASADIVLTTYNLVQKEVKLPEYLKKDKAEQEKPVGEDQVIDGDGPLARIAWRRIVLDEAHNIKNSKSTTALSVCRLRAKYRWALSGTPIQNDLLDFYSLLRYLRCSPFDELKVWKKWVDNKNASGDKRLEILVKGLVLRRTKNQKTHTGAALVPLPDKKVDLVELEFSEYERKLYDQLFSRCQNVLVKYLASHEQKGLSSSKPSTDRIKGDTILLMLLRLRQCCSHPSLTNEKLVDEELEGEGIELDLVSAMNELDIQDKNKGDASPLEAQKDLRGNDSQSTKIRALVEKMQSLDKSSSINNKYVVVSQWTSMLELVGKALTSSGYSYYVIRGDVPPKKRAEMVQDFNINPASPKVMLVSLRAGGVGLNLVGANNLFIMDLHWNPALEQQACDRIYRVGQQNDVTIHKLICKGTIEQQILLLQKNKLELAENALTGTKTAASKLSLHDLKVLFGLAVNPSSTLQQYGASGFY